LSAEGGSGRFSGCIHRGGQVEGMLDNVQKNVQKVQKVQGSSRVQKVQEFKRFNAFKSSIDSKNDQYVQLVQRSSISIQFFK
jgi:hypothetical protein